MAAVGAAKKASKRISYPGKPLPRFTSGNGDKSKLADKSSFQSRFKSMKPEQRHKLVQKTFEKRFGKDWRQKVYGKNFKPGTLKKENRIIQSSRAREKQVTSKLRKLEEKRVSTPDSASNKDAIRKRIAELQKRSGRIESRLIDTKQSRKKFLETRNKALPKAIKANRMRSDTDKDKKQTETAKAILQGKKKKNKSISGGTTAK
jgi:hypothetical protein